MFRNKNFNLLWSAQAATDLGTSVTLFLLPLIAVLYLHAGAFTVGLLVFSEYISASLVALWAGGFVDSRIKKPTLIACDLVRALLLVTIPLFYFLNLLSTLQLVITALLLGGIGVLFEITYPPFLLSVTAREELLSANAKIQATESTARIIGPGLGGFLVQLLIAPLAILFDSISYLLSAFFTSQIKVEETVDRENLIKKSALTHLKVGLLGLFKHPVLKYLAIYMFVFNIFSLIINATYLPFVITQLKLAPALAGLTLSLGGIGALLAATTVKSLTNKLGEIKALSIFLSITAVGTLLLPFAGGATILIMTMLIGGQLGIAFGETALSVAASTLRQLSTPPATMARIGSGARLVSSLAFALGGLFGGILGALMGPKMALIISGLGQLLALIPIFLLSQKKAICKISSIRLHDSKDPASPLTNPQ